MISKAQQLMVEDGLPSAALLTEDERRVVWKGRRLTKVLDVARKAQRQASLQSARSSFSTLPSARLVSFFWTACVF
jgi:hypothetical protein